jgi:hypothetical protein
MYLNTLASQPGPGQGPAAETRLREIPGQRYLHLEYGSGRGCTSLPRMGGNRTNRRWVAKTATVISPISVR